jgi:hypothetical protein
MSLKFSSVPRNVLSPYVQVIIIPVISGESIAPTGYPRMIYIDVMYLTLEILTHYTQNY